MIDLNGPEHEIKRLKIIALIPSCQRAAFRKPSSEYLFLGEPHDYIRLRLNTSGAWTVQYCCLLDKKRIYEFSMTHAQFSKVFPGWQRFLEVVGKNQSSFDDLLKEFESFNKVDDLPKSEDLPRFVVAYEVRYIIVDLITGKIARPNPHPEAFSKPQYFVNHIAAMEDDDILKDYFG